MRRVAPRAGSLGWISRGACRQVDPDLFFPIAAATSPAVRQVEAAKAVCARCAVRAECLSYALATMPEGIWGGTTEEERLAARRSPGRRFGRQFRGTVNAAITEEPAVRAGQRVAPGRTAS
jgi:WhiB family transcriptional regulator, redox-sensing transcriptional regulator